MTKRPRIFIAESGRIEAYGDFTDQFLMEMVGVSGALVTDLSSLSDFFGCGMDGESDLADTDPESFRAVWNAWVVDRVCKRFRIEPFDPRMHLVDLFALIEAVKPVQ